MTKVEKSPSAKNLRKNHRTICDGSERESGRRSAPAFNVCIQYSWISYRSGVVDWGSDVFAGCSPRVQLFV